MSVLLSATKIEKSHGARLLFQNLSFGVETGQKIGLIGPNGAGKSTLLRILSGQDKVDAGRLDFAVGLRMAFLEQNPVFKDDETVMSTLLEATGDPWEAENIGFVSELMSRLELDGPQAGADRLARELSGGWQKRVALARELAKRPDLLLLDEPTNHLDVASIEWIEDFLAARSDLALITITHDRLFLQNTCDLIFDLDRRNPDGLIKFNGTYADFTDFKDATMAAQRTLESTRKNLLRRETAWLRRGAKARQTKQKARIERAGDLSAEVADLSDKNRDRKVNLDFGDVGRSPKKIIEAKNITKKDGDRFLFKDFSYILGARSRIGLLGPNGCGKTTLIRTLLGQIQPDGGSVTQADGITFAVFEQRKESLTPGVSVLKTICPQGDNVLVQGKPVFARSYLSRFHFQAAQMDMPVEKLSGGEQTRLMLARLMLQTEPVLVLDEPTNDLDLETLDTLQDALINFPGAVILVTHDRFFLDQVSDELLAFTPSGKIERFADLFQWEQWKKTQEAERVVAEKAAKATGAAAGKKPGRLSFKDQREFDSMEATIQEAERTLSALQAEIALPANQSDYSKLQSLSSEAQKQQQLIDRLYARWQDLSDQLGSSK